MLPREAEGVDFLGGTRLDIGGIAAREEAGDASNDSANSRAPPGALLLLQQVVVIGHLLGVLVATHLDREEAGLEVNGVHEVGVQRGVEGLTAITHGAYAESEVGGEGTEGVAAAAGAELGGELDFTAIGAGQAEGIDTSHDESDAKDHKIEPETATNGVPQGSEVNGGLLLLQLLYCIGGVLFHTGYFLSI